MNQLVAANRYRLSLDLGVGSIGWVALVLSNEGNPQGILDCGSRIFGTGRKPKDNTTLAGTRRDARGARRRRDRQIMRRNKTIATLIRHGLFPREKKFREALKNRNPWELRHDALERELSPHELGRALFHLQQRRGFKSNRKADRGSSDAGDMKTAIREFAAKIGTDETVGSFLWREIQSGKGARARHKTVGSKTEYDFYVDRSMVEDEFERIWETQKGYHHELLTEVAYQDLKEAIFFQRPLKPVESGRCFLDPNESRAPKALPSTHFFRILQEVNSLRVLDESDPFVGQRALTIEERDEALGLLLTRKEMAFSSLAARLFGKGSRIKFNLEAGARSRIKGDAVAAQMSSSKAFGKSWSSLELLEQDEIVGTLLDLVDDEDAQIFGEELQEKYGLTETQSAYVTDSIKLDDGYARLSSKAMRSMIPFLFDGWDDEQDQALTYNQAAEMAGYNFNVAYGTGEIFDYLPYYGQILNRYTADVPRLDDLSVAKSTNPDEAKFGRIANPTVHIGLGELRKIVNALIERYGKPEEVHIEVARELSQSKELRAETSKRRNENEKINRRLDQELELFGLKKSRANRERLKLFEELAQIHHQCVLCGTSIEKNNLFTNNYQVDHILPFSRTLDDGFSNKILVCAKCNQQKGNMSPFEKWGHDEDRWPDIFTRVSILNRNKVRRFEADAMERFEADGGFIARQLTDTAYLSRVAREYLGCLYVDPAEIQRRIVVSPGRLTAMLRARWGLNYLLGDTGEKNRADHRHHAVDAIVIGVADRSILKRVSDANRQAREGGLQRLLEDMPLPWPNFREEAAKAIESIVVSHKPDHGTGGQLHEETAYGVIEGPNKKGEYLTRKRKEDGTVEEKWRQVIPIYRSGDDPSKTLPYKAYIGGSNHCVEISENEKGKWAAEIISTYQANQPDYQKFLKDRKNYLKHTFSGKPLVMRLHAGDTVSWIDDGELKIFRLVKMSSLGQLFFRMIADARVEAKSLISKNAGPLKQLKARRVFIDVLGRVKDPGWQE